MSFKKRQFARWSYALASTVVTVAAGAPALAQEAPDAVQRVVVTGSNIKRTDAEGPAAVQVISRDAIERSGQQTVAAVIRSISADNNGSISEAFSNGFAAGASGVSLRGLSVSSTLVLLNGRRTAPYGLADDGQRNFVDLNSIPLEAVDRIEVLKEGASAIYGSDAIAGVVNIILRQNYQGKTLTGSYGQAGVGDGKVVRGAVTLGFGDIDSDKYNVFVNLEANKQQEIWQKDRGDSFLGSSDTRRIGGNDRRLGQIDVDQGSTGNNLYGAVLRRNPDGSAIPGLWYQQLPGCPPSAVAAGVGGTLNSGGGCLWDPIQFSQIQPDTQRVNLFARVTAQLNPTLQAYGEAGVYSSKVQTITTPSPITSTWPDIVNNTVINNGTTLLLPVGHPDNPFPANPARVRFRPEAVPRTGYYDTLVTRAVAGLKGSAYNWDYDTALLYARDRTKVEQDGYVRYSTLQAALANGTYRIGRNFGLTSAATLAAVYPHLENKAITEVKSVDFKATRDLLKLSGGQLALALGAEYRRESIDTPATPFTLQADIVGLGYSSANSARNVSAVYGELVAPVLSRLELQAAVRTDRYSDYGNSTTPKVGFKYTPFTQLAVRGTYSEGFRAPGAAENGNSASAGYSSFSNDPVRCAVTRQAVDCTTSTTIVLITAGNPAVQPETSKSYSLGLILEPIRNVSATLDFWRIERSNEILAADAAQIIANPTGTPNARIIRGEPTVAFPNLVGPILAVAAPYLNGLGTITSGVDIDVNGRWNVAGLGTVRLGGQVTQIFEFRKTFTSGETVNYVGTHGPTSLSGNVGTPRTKAALDAGWESGPWSVSGRVNYTSAIRDVENTAGDCLDVSDDTGEPILNCKIASFTTLDLFGRWKFGKRWELSASVRNVFNKLPPFDIQTYGGINYNPTLHTDGAIGRFFSLTGRVTF